MDTALYFPRIRVPHTAWFTQVLLYWDGGAAIVPRDLEQDESELGEYMTQLVGAKLVDLIRPKQLLVNFPDSFEEEFLRFLDANDLVLGAYPRWTRIHIDKMEWHLFQALSNKGLARRGFEWDPRLWWELEETTAELYLAYLAGMVCGLRDDVYPVTDSSRSVADLGWTGADVTSKLRALRYRAITQALPAPSEPVSVAEIIAFKEARQDQLSRLRVYLDGRLAELAAISDEEMCRVRVNAILQEIRDEV